MLTASTFVAPLVHAWNAIPAEAPAFSRGPPLPPADTVQALEAARREAAEGREGRLEAEATRNKERLAQAGLLVSADRTPPAGMHPADRPLCWLNVQHRQGPRHRRISQTTHA